MKRTGVFYHGVCGKEAYKTLLMGVEEGFESLKSRDLFSESLRSKSAETQKKDIPRDNPWKTRKKLGEWSIDGG